MNLDELPGFNLGPRKVAFDDRTTILYALCAGATNDELDLVWEQHLRPLPALATSLGLWAVEAAGELGAYDRRTSLHVGQRLRILQPMPAAGEIDMSARIEAVIDKGRAAIVEIAVTSPYFELGYTIFLPGYGGFGGHPGAPAAPAAPFEPTLTTSVPTDDRLALFYRLTGDRHPVHVDPATAVDNGFERPILHGLCTLAIASRAVARIVGAHPADLTELDGRFAAPVTPGDILEVRASVDATVARFEVLVGDRVVLKDGRARF
jgi:acyl dehydratase